jgi:hypothetical protein
MTREIPAERFAANPEELSNSGRMSLLELHDEPDKQGDASDQHFLQDAAAVLFECLVADGEIVRDALAWFAEHPMIHDLVFARRQRRNAGAVLFERYRRDRRTEIIQSAFDTFEEPGVFERLLDEVHGPRLHGSNRRAPVPEPRCDK